MVVITCVVAADNGPAQYLSDVSLSWWNLQKEDQYTGVVLVSGQFQVRVHREILIRVSSFLHSLVPPSCSCETPVITLPSIHEDTLKALVELAYTGRSKIESRKAKEEFEELTQVLQIGLEIEYQEIVSQERADHGIRVNQVSSVIVKTAGGKVTASEAAAQRKKSEEKAERNIYEQRATSDESKNEEEIKVYTDNKKNKEKDKEKTTSTKDLEEASEPEFIAALGLKRNIEKKTVAFRKKEENEMPAPKNVDKTVLEEMPREAENEVVSTKMKQSAYSVEMHKVQTSLPVKVGGSPRLTRGRTRSTVQETQYFSSPSPIGHRRATEKADNILAKTTRNQKRKIQTFLNVSDEIDRQVITEPKRQKLDLIVRSTEKESSRFINIQDITAESIADTDGNENNNGVVQDPIKVCVSNNAMANPFENLESSILSDEGDKDAKFVCPFCKIEFQKKSRYDYHLSWNHFRGEIADKFPGLKCGVCAKSFRKKSNYVSHMGSFHKIIDGLMRIVQIREDKMAQIREAKQHQPFASPQAKRKDDSWLETIKHRNTSTPNEKRLTSSKGSDESIDMATPSSVVSLSTPCSAIYKESTMEDEEDGNREKVETIENIQAFINELPKSKL